MSSRLSHLQGVRLLYKSCLKLHRGLPLELKAIGDSYVKEEFRRHKEASPEHSKVFMQQWAVSCFLRLRTGCSTKEIIFEYSSVAVVQN